jgi:hypothetical protein
MQLWKELPLQAPPSYQKVSRSIIKIEPATLDDEQLFDHGHDSLQAIPFSSKGSFAQPAGSSLRKNDDLYSLRKFLAEGGKEVPGKLGRLLNRWSSKRLGVSNPQRLAEINSLGAKDESTGEHRYDNQTSSTRDAVQQRNQRSSPDPLVAVPSLEGSRKIISTNVADDKEDEDEGSVSISDESEYVQEDQQDNLTLKDTERSAARAAEPVSTIHGDLLSLGGCHSPAAVAMGKKRKSIAKRQEAEKRTKQGNLSRCT